MTVPRFNKDYTIMIPKFKTINKIKTVSYLPVLITLTTSIATSNKIKIPVRINIQ